MTITRVGVALCVALTVGGCAAWEDHNKETKESRNDFEMGRFDAALTSLEKGVNNELDGLCYQLDSGIVAQVGGRYDVSIKNFEHAENTIEKFEDRGVTVQGAAEQVGAFAVNEKTIPYEGEDFEKILVPVFNSRNYLLQHQIEDAMVEARKIWYQQKVCRQLHEKQLAETDKKAREEKVDTKNLGDIDSKVQYPAEALKSPESIYEITVAHYISALIAERMGEWNDAYIAMKDTAKIRPDLPFVQRDLVRFASALYMSDDVDEYKKKYPNVRPPAKNEGSVALLFDCGWAPHKEELKFPVPGYKTFAAVAVPLYKRTPDPGHHARLVLNDKVFDTHVMSDLEAIVFKYHRDKLPMIIIRQIIRTTLKAAAGSGAALGTEKAVGKKWGGLAGAAVGLGAGIYNYESEQADLRAWLTLPRNFQATRAWVPEGDYDAKVELVGVGGSVLNTLALGKLHVKAGSLRFACARSLGNAIYGTLLQEREDRAPKVPKAKETDLVKPDAPKKPAAPDKSTTVNANVPDAEKPAVSPDKTDTSSQEPAPDKSDKKADEAPKADAPSAGDTPPEKSPDDMPKGDAPKPDAGGDAPKPDAGGDAPKSDAGGDAPKSDAGGDAPKPDAGGEKPKDKGGE
jgi:hypothetical protein